MAGPGLLAGLQGYESVAEGPARRVSEGIAGAVDQGIGAYTAVSRVRQGAEEGARSQQRLDMAQALQPGQIRAQQLGNDTHALALQEAGNRITRQDDARAYGKTIQERMMKKPDEGGYATPEEFQLDVVNMSMRLGDPEHLKGAFSDYKLLLDKSETSKQLGGAIMAYTDTMRKAGEAKTPEERISIGLDGLTQIYKNFPIGATHPLMNSLTGNILKHAEDTQPKAISDAVSKYQQIRMTPDITDAQAWSRAHEGLHPGFWPAMEKLKPQSIKDEEAATRAGQVHGAQKTAELPSELAKVKATGEAHIEAAKIHNQGLIDLEKEREKGREARQKPENVALKQRSDALGKRIATNRGILTSIMSSEGDKETARQQMEADTREQDIVIREMATRGVTRAETAGPEAGAGAPGGLSQSRVSDVRAWMGSKVRSMADVEKALQHPQVQGQLSPEDVAAIRGEYQRKFGGR